MAAMKVSNKFRVLQILAITSFIQAGRLQGKGRWYLSLYTLMYLIGTAVLIESLFEEAQESLMGGRNGPRPGPDERQDYPSYGLVNDSLTPTTGIENAPDDNPDGPPPPSPLNNTEDDMEVVRLTMTTNGLLSAAISLILRSFGVIFFPQIIKAFRALIAREFCEKSKTWTRDELLLLFVIICGVFVQFQHMNAGRNDFGTANMRRTFQNLLRIVIIIFECYPLDCTAFALVVFTTVVTENLLELCSLLGRKEDEGKVGMGNDHVENLSEKLESLIDFQLTAKLRATAAIVASTGKITAGGAHKSKKVQPVFIIHHHEPGLEILGLKDMTYLTQRYLLWHELWEEASGVTGFITLVLFLSSTVNLCIYSYTGITGFSKKGLDGMATQNCILAVLSILRLLCLGNVAQNLIDVGEELEEKLIMEGWEEESSDYFVSLDMEKEKEISYLLHHMAQHPIRLSALGFFTASRSTLTSIAGVIVTYLVVLIQFG